VLPVANCFLIYSHVFHPKVINSDFRTDREQTKQMQSCGLDKCRVAIDV
jgi:hypothetical protein